MENLIEELLQLAEECVPINLGSLKNSLGNIIEESKMLADYGAFVGESNFCTRGGFFIFEFEQTEYTIYFVPYIKDVCFEYFNDKYYCNDENVVITKITLKTTKGLKSAIFINKHYSSSVFKRNNTKVIYKIMRE